MAFVDVGRAVRQPADEPASSRSPRASGHPGTWQSAAEPDCCWSAARAPAFQGCPVGPAAPAWACPPGPGPRLARAAGSEAPPAERGPAKLHTSESRPRHRMALREFSRTPHQVQIRRRTGLTADSRMHESVQDALYGSLPSMCSRRVVAPRRGAVSDCIHVRHRCGKAGAAWVCRDPPGVLSARRVGRNGGLSGCA